jgi:hypothetical protein
VTLHQVYADRDTDKSRATRIPSTIVSPPFCSIRGLLSVCPLLTSLFLHFLPHFLSGGFRGIGNDSSGEGAANEAASVAKSAFAVDRVS